jgi:hypothetical protein
MKSIDQIYASLAPISLNSCFLLSSASPLLPILRPPPLVAMVSSPSTSRYQSENDLRTLRKAIGWLSLGYDSMMRHGMLSLAHLGDFIYFSVYALAGLVLPLSFFLYCWSTIAFSLNTCRRTPSCWWQSLPTSVR